MKSELTKSDITKKALLEAMVGSLGIVTVACNTVGCSRDTFYRYMKEDADFKLAIEDISEIALDFAESQLHKKIAGVKVTVDGQSVFKKEPDTTAIIFYLKTKGRNRGYIERQDIGLIQEQPLFPYDEADYVDVTED